MNRRAVRWLLRLLAGSTLAGSLVAYPSNPEE